MKKIILSIIVASTTHVFGQGTCTSTSDGRWGNNGTWDCPGAPVDNYDGEYIVINSDVTIGNNNDIDLTGSNVKTITITSNNTLTFNSNAKLYLPGGAEVILEVDAKIEASNNSQGTLIEIGGNGVWGRNCSGCSNNDLVGAGIINEGSAPGSPLPVTFSSIQASKEGSSLTVDWATEMELNNDFFTIEISHDQENWTAVSTVEGAGNSAETLHYTETVISDHTIRYVRIKQTDYDGKYAHSNIIGLEHKSHNISIYPNPASDIIHINDIPEESVVSLYSTKGHVVYNTTVAATSHSITINHLEKGMYFLHIQQGSFSTKEKVVVK